jgi:membrane dipeptidase
MTTRPLVVDAMMPWNWGGEGGRAAALDRRHAVGGFVSLTMSGDPSGPAEALATIARTRARLAADPARFALATSAVAIREAHAAGRLAVGLNFQGASPVGADLDLVDAFAALGVRQIGLAYNARNRLADGCHEPDDARLSDFGIAAVRRMQQAGVIVDLSHVGRRSGLHATEIATRPVVFSHSNAAWLAPHPRNIDRDQMRAIAATGGIIGLNGMGLLLADPACRTETLARHATAIAETVGPVHVGLGLDWVYDLPFMQSQVDALAATFPRGHGYADVPLSFAAPEQAFDLTDALRAAGWGEPDIAGLLGGNWLRVMAACWGG